MSTKSRHEQLLDAGWIYDAAQDRYQKPGSATDGTARRYNLAAAWEQYQADQLDAASMPDTSKRVTRAADPRKQEPE